ncbi:MAG: D-aminoacyl-tRNA deacylase [Bacteroidota bacterium]|nr:D-aminoacyl-tRNA deacylase [Bacteroidota bacterium]
MRAVIQRVSKASVEIEGAIVGAIEVGLMILLGIENKDTEEDVEWLCRKISKMRIFPDSNDVMNKSLIDINGNALVISQFTLHAETKKGNRPSYIKAAKPDISNSLYRSFVKQLEKEINKIVETGEFGAHMNVSLVNDGPVTIILDSKRKE